MGARGIDAGSARRRTVRTMCPMNCHPTLCGMLVDVEDGRLLGVRGDPDNPDSRGFLCVRGQASREIVDNPHRLLHPLVRARRGEDEWRQASWDEALDLVAGRMRAAGREAVGLWSGHGLFANNYGTRVGSHLLRRFANLWGCQWWHPSMICWGLGGFGLGLTGVLEANTKEDMGRHASLIVLWGANLASQPNTGPHLAAARRRGAGVVTIDVRETEAAAQSDEVVLIRPGTDAALALAMMSVIIGEGLHDAAFVAGHTVGFDALAAHVRDLGPDWAAPITGVPAERIAALARRYATTRPAMILLGGSSMHKGGSGWQAARAVSCLPALAGHLGVPGGGLGPRHGAASHGQALSDISATRAPAAGRLRPEPDAARHRGARRRPRPRAPPLRDEHAVLVRRRGAGGRGPRARRPRGEPRPLLERHGAPVRGRRPAGDLVARGARVQEHEHAPLPHAEGAGAPRRGAPGGVDPPGARPPARRRRLLPVGHRRGPARRDPRPPGDRARDGGRPPGRGRHPRAPDLARRPSHARLRHAVGQGRALLGARGGARPPALAGLRARAPHRPIRSRSGRGERSPSSTASTTTGRRCRRSPASTPSPASGSRRPTRPPAASPTARRSACSTSGARSAPART